LYLIEYTDLGLYCSTGVGGLTLGGGFGYLTGEYGNVIDNLLEVEIVLASGEIVKASDQENTDLFWALRGAGHGFGVVTEFLFKAHDIPSEVWGGINIFPAEQLPAILEFANNNIAIDSGKAPMVSTANFRNIDWILTLG
jgi:FAD/FMN-containing dehydrogenase